MAWPDGGDVRQQRIGARRAANPAPDAAQSRTGWRGAPARLAHLACNGRAGDAVLLVLHGKGGMEVGVHGRHARPGRTSPIGPLGVTIHTSADSCTRRGALRGASRMRQPLARPCHGPLARHPRRRDRCRRLTDRRAQSVSCNDRGARFRPDNNDAQGGARHAGDRSMCENLPRRTSGLGLSREMRSLTPLRHGVRVTSPR
jgi:hypothetical protein